MEASNSSNITVAAFDDSGITVSLISLLVNAFIATLNIFCLVVLFKDKKLKENRFESMVIGLSISDAVTSTLMVMFNLRNIAFQLTGSRVKMFCYINLTLITSTWVFSVLQIFWICIERLLATFPTIKSFKTPVPVVYLILLSVCVLFFVPFYAIIGDVWTDGACSYVTLLGKNRSLSAVVVNPFYLVIIIALIVVYTIIFYRTYSSWKRVNPGNVRSKRNTGVAPAEISSIQNNFASTHETSGTDYTVGKSTENYQPKAKGTKNRENQMMKLAVTLGILSGIFLVSYTPRVVSVFVVYFNPTNRSAQVFEFYAALILYLTPVMNPIVYVMRIRRFRERLTCSCCIFNK